MTEDRVGLEPTPPSNVPVEDLVGRSSDIKIHFPNNVLLVDNMHRKSIQAIDGAMRSGATVTITSDSDLVHVVNGSMVCFVEIASKDHRTP